MNAGVHVHVRVCAYRWGESSPQQSTIVTFPVVLENAIGSQGVGIMCRGTSRVVRDKVVRDGGVGRMCGRMDVGVWIW